MTRRLVLLALVATLSTACGQALGSPQSAAVINGEVISNDAVEDLARGDIGRSDPGTEEITTERDASVRALNDLSLLTIYRQQIVELGGTPVDEVEVDSAVAQTEEQFGGPEVLQAALAQQGISPEQLRHLLSLELSRERLTTELGSDVEIPEEAVQQIYDTQVAPPTVAHILVETEAEAQTVLDRLADGEIFADLANELSIDPGSAATGGDLGPLQPGAFVPEFEEAAIALAEGEVSDPVSTQFGFHIITVPEAEPIPDDIRQSIVAFLTVQQVQPEVDDLLRNALDEAEAAVNPRFGRWAPVYNPQAPQLIAGADDPLGDLVPVGGAAAPDDGLLPPDPLAPAEPLPPPGQ